VLVPPPYIKTHKKRGSVHPGLDIFVGVFVWLVVFSASVVWLSCARLVFLSSSVVRCHVRRCEWCRVPLSLGVAIYGALASGRLGAPSGGWCLLYWCCSGVAVVQFRPRRLLWVLCPSCTVGRRLWLACVGEHCCERGASSVGCFGFVWWWFVQLFGSGRGSIRLSVGTVFVLWRVCAVMFARWRIAGWWVLGAGAGCCGFGCVGFRWWRLVVLWAWRVVVFVGGCVPDPSLRGRSAHVALCTLSRGVSFYTVPLCRSVLCLFCWVLQRVFSAVMFFRRRSFR